MQRAEEHTHPTCGSALLVHGEPRPDEVQALARDASKDDPCPVLPGASAQHRGMRQRSGKCQEQLSLAIESTAVPTPADAEDCIVGQPRVIRPALDEHGIVDAERHDAAEPLEASDGVHGLDTVSGSSFEEATQSAAK